VGTRCLGFLAVVRMVPSSHPYPSRPCNSLDFIRHCETGWSMQDALNSWTNGYRYVKLIKTARQRSFERFDTSQSCYESSTSISKKYSEERIELLLMSFRAQTWEELARYSTYLLEQHCRPILSYWDCISTVASGVALCLERAHLTHGAGDCNFLLQKNGGGHGSLAA
jgi:hypothetical protein